jgi:hypothetical protein
MSNDTPDTTNDTERTATDEMADRYRNGGRPQPVNNDPENSEPTGLPKGMKDSDKSPVAPF